MAEFEVRSEPHSSHGSTVCEKETPHSQHREFTPSSHGATYVKGTVPSQQNVMPVKGVPPFQFTMKAELPSSA